MKSIINKSSFFFFFLCILLQAKLIAQNVGINTPVPSAKLHVSGAISVVEPVNADFENGNLLPATNQGDVDWFVTNTDGHNSTSSAKCPVLEKKSEWAILQYEYDQPLNKNVTLEFYYKYVDLNNTASFGITVNGVDYFPSSTPNSWKSFSISFIGDGNGDKLEFKVVANQAEANPQILIDDIKIMHKDGHGMKLTDGTQGAGYILESDDLGHASWVDLRTEIDETVMAALPPSTDTSRTLKSDLLLTSTICNCSSIPPAMIQSLTDNGYSIQDLVDFKIKIQDLLDFGYTPMALFNVGVPLSSFYGKSYAGGIIFYLNTNTGNGLVSAKVDQSLAAQWGCQGTSISGANGTAIGTGNTNTAAIITQCTTSGIAAEICISLTLNGFNDWFLPSRDELLEMYLKIGQGAAPPNNNVGEFSNMFYWSSSEDTIDFSWGNDFDSTNQFTEFKNNHFPVRAIRAF